jgi:hypothetical protein
LAVSGATVDRLLKPTRDGGQLLGLPGTRAGQLLRNSIQISKAGDEHEQDPGFVEADLVLHCGATLQGEFARSLTVTDVLTGWTENMALKNGDVVRRHAFQLSDALSAPRKERARREVTRGSRKNRSLPRRNRMSGRADRASR